MQTLRVAFIGVPSLFLLGLASLAADHSVTCPNQCVECAKHVKKSLGRLATQQNEAGSAGTQQLSQQRLPDTVKDATAQPSPKLQPPLAPSRVQSPATPAGAVPVAPQPPPQAISASS